MNIRIGLIGLSFLVSGSGVMLGVGYYRTVQAPLQSAMVTGAVANTHKSSLAPSGSSGSLGSFDFSKMGLNLSDFGKVAFNIPGFVTQALLKKSDRAPEFLKSDQATVALSSIAWTLAGVALYNYMDGTQKIKGAYRGGKRALYKGARSANDWSLGINYIYNSAGYNLLRMDYQDHIKTNNNYNTLMQAFDNIMNSPFGPLILQQYNKGAHVQAIAQDIEELKKIYNPLQEIQNKATLFMSGLTALEESVVKGIVGAGGVQNYINRINTFQPTPIDALRRAEPNIVQKLNDSRNILGAITF